MRHAQPQPEDATRRSLSLRLISGGQPDTLDEKARTVEVVAASEDPVATYDWVLGTVGEVLRLDGLEVPDNGQVPLVDSHARFSTDNVLGSARLFRREGGQLVCTVHFAEDEAAARAFAKVRDGHLTDFSVGFRIDEVARVKDGEAELIHGVSYEGPLRVVTQARLMELSLVAVGADPAAKARNAIVQGEVEMDENEKEDAGQERKSAAPLNASTPPVSVQERGAIQDVATPSTATVDVAQVKREEQGRIKEITALCARFGCDDLIETAVDNNWTMDAARAAVLERQDAKAAGAQQPGAVAEVEVQRTANEKLNEAVQQALFVRSGLVEGAARDAALLTADGLAALTLRELGLEMLRRTGGDTRFNHPYELAKRALTTTDLPMLLLEVGKKSLMQGWQTEKETWQIWCKVSQVNDFRPVDLVDYELTGNLEEIPEASEKYPILKHAESGASMRIKTYGAAVKFSRQAFINNNLGILTESPEALGKRSVKLVGDLAYGVLLVGKLSDGITDIFTAEKGNLRGTGAQPGVDELEAMSTSMMAIEDGNGEFLGIEPVYILGPKTRKYAWERFFKTVEMETTSTVDGVTAKMTTENPFAGEVLTRVYDRRLESKSGPAPWFLAGEKGRTVTVVGLNGPPEPYIELYQLPGADGLDLRVRTDVGAAAVDWRALAKNPGTA